MAKFSEGKYNKGTNVLSYMYAAEEGGKQSNISIKYFDGEDGKTGWHFLDSDGKIKSKLSPTHIKNLTDDKIFASTSIDSETGGDLPNQSEGSEAPANTSVNLENSNFSLPQNSLPGSSTNTGSSIIPPGTSTVKSRPIGENAPYTRSNFDKGIIGSGYSENTAYIPNAAPVLSSSPGSVPPANVSLGLPPDANEITTLAGTNYTVATAPISANTAVADAQRFNEANYNTYANPNQSALEGTATLAQGTQRYDSPVIDYGSGGEFSGSGAVVPRPEDIDVGIKDQDNPWGSTEGWNAAGSVMKGVGGLASAYTGIQNYKLARDAHTTQQNQWQQNYDQRLDAYKNDKISANNEIAAKNRILKARNPDRPLTDYYAELK